MSLHEESLDAYLRALALQDEDALLADMHALALERSFPIVGPEVGRFLAQLVHLLGARRIFEMGSGFGYSALWLGRALPDQPLHLGLVIAGERESSGWWGTGRAAGWYDAVAAVRASCTMPTICQGEVSRRIFPSPRCSPSRPSWRRPACW